MPNEWTSTHTWIGIALATGVFWIWLQGRGDGSWFRVREADRERRKKNAAADDPLGKARLEKQAPLLLTGIRTSAPAHEILGVSLDASRSEILKAHRDKMKQYHPDKLAPPNTPQWVEAQAIAAAINRAKEEMIRRLS